MNTHEYEINKRIRSDRLLDRKIFIIYFHNSHIPIKVEQPKRTTLAKDTINKPLSSLYIFIDK